MIELLRWLLRLRRHSRRVWYRTEYLHNQHWNDFRHGWWKRHPAARCYRCGSGHPLDLHHLTYERIGRERDSDVIPLCRADHERAHDRGPGVTLVPSH